jgi:hypothetical protein
VGRPATDSLTQGRIGVRKGKLRDPLCDRVEHGVVRGRDGATVSRIRRPSRTDLCRRKALRRIEQLCLARSDTPARASLLRERVYGVPFALGYESQCHRRKLEIGRLPSERLA